MINECSFSFTEPTQLGFLSLEFSYKITFNYKDGNMTLLITIRPIYIAFWKIQKKKHYNLQEQPKVRWLGLWGCNGNPIFLGFEFEFRHCQSPCGQCHGGGSPAMTLGHSWVRGISH